MIKAVDFHQSLEPTSEEPGDILIEVKESDIFSRSERR